MIGQFFVPATPAKSINLRRQLAANGIDASHAPGGIAITADESKIQDAAAIAYCLTGQQLIPGRSDTTWKCASGNRQATEALLSEGVEASLLLKKAGVNP
jgi:hypothetical protein